MRNEFPIDWHEQCHFNASEYWKSEETRCRERLAWCEREKIKLDEYRALIELAKSEGVKVFDKDRFGKKRKGRTK